MTNLTMLMRTTAVAALAALALAPIAAHAQTQQTQQAQQAQQGQTGIDNVEDKQLPGTGAQGAGEAQTGGQTQQGGQTMAGQGQGQGQDVVVARVGEREIRRSDIMAVIGMLPPQLQQQPPEMLIPIALDQLVMRELILDKAQEAGLENDPAVTSLAADASERAKEDAMVQVWLDQELATAVTDEKVQETYDTVKQQMGDQAPAIDELRPQIEQELRQRAFVDLSKELQTDADVTLYGPDGQPITQ
jgi:hypothetical protein